MIARIIGAIWRTRTCIYCGTTYPTDVEGAACEARCFAEWQRNQK